MEQQGSKASEGPRRTGLDPHRQFAVDIIDAYGQWVELDMKDANASNMPRTVLVHIGQEYAEVTQRDGVLFGRLRVRPT
jgi:hypothetical protein